MKLDHFVVGVDLPAEGQSWASSTLGIALQPGGSHAGRGTCNNLAGLGDSYLEVLSRDSEQLPTPVLNLPDDVPVLLHWCIRAADLESVERRAESLGLTSYGISDWERQTPSGDRLRWKLLFLGGVEYAGVLPFFIDWCDTLPPSRSLPAQARAAAFRVQTPDAALLSRLVEGLDGAPEISESSASALELALESDSGRVVEVCSDEAYLSGLLGIANARQS